MGGKRVSDQKLEEMLGTIAPCTLPVHAYGQQPIEWYDPPRLVWAWVTWPHKPAERIPGVAFGGNDWVVMFRWTGDGGMVDCVVWRNAVTVRTTE